MDLEKKLSIEDIEIKWLFLQGLFNTIATPINYKDLNGKFVDCNQAFVDLIGKKKEEIIGKTPYDVWAKSTADILAGLDLDILKTDVEEKKLEVEYENLYGRKGIAIFNKHIFRDKTGKKAGIVVSINDITEQKNIEKKLIKSESLFRSYFNLAGAGIAITSPEKGWIEVNDKLCSMLGYTREEIIKKTWAEMTHPDDLAADEKQFNRLLSGEIENYNLDKRFIRKDKTVIWTGLSVGCVRRLDGKVDYFVALLEDITERKYQQKELERKEQFLDFISDSVFVHDLDGKFIYVNNAAYLTRGYTKEELMVKNLGELDVPEKAELIEARIKSLTEKKEIVFESAHFKKDGTVMPIEIHSKLIEIDGKKYIVSSARDLTERKKYEEAFKINEEKFKKVTEALFNPLIIMDDAGTVTYWNRASEKMFGYKAEEIMGENLHKLLSSKEYDIENSASLKNFFKTGQSPMMDSVIELSAIDKQGNKIPIELSASPLTLGGKIFAIGSIRDLREKKESEQKINEKIKELERFNRLMVDRELKMIELKEELKRYKNI